MPAKNREYWSIISSQYKITQWFSSTVVKVTHKDISKQCVAGRGAEVTTGVKIFSVSEARDLEYIWRANEKTVQIAENTKRCKWTIEGHVYVLSKYFVTFLNKNTFLVPIVMFYTMISSAILRREFNMPDHQDEIHLYASST